MLRAPQRLDLSQAPLGGEGISPHAKRILPDLAPLARNLTALSLADNRLTRLPAGLAKLTNLVVLDVSGARAWTRRCRRPA